MASNLPPDPYLALGIPKDATPAAIKTAHRKLVLKHHPDKVSDPTLKESAADLFHKIQSAYEILIDNDRRARYDAEVRLHSLRKENAQDRMSREVPRARDHAKTSARHSHEPTSARTTSTAHARDSDYVPPVYEVRQPAYASADAYDAPPRGSARKEPRDSDYDRPARRSAPESKEKPRHTTTRTAKDHAQTKYKERSKHTQQEKRRERDQKFGSYRDSLSDDSDSSDDYTRADPAMDRKAREYFHEMTRRQREDAERGIFTDERARKRFDQDADARAHMETIRNRRRPDVNDRRPDSGRRSDSDRRPEPDRSDRRADADRWAESDRRPDPERLDRRDSERLDRRDSERQDRRSDSERQDRRPDSERLDRRAEAERLDRRPDSSNRRPSPPSRGATTREKVDSDSRPTYVVRQPSSRPTSSRDIPDMSSRRSARRDDDRRASVEPANDFLRPVPPPFHSTKSSPADIRIPNDKPRAMSLQHDFADPTQPPGPPRRAETMPYDRGEKSVPKISTANTDFAHGLPTPGPTPTYEGPLPTKYSSTKPYADDIEIPTPDGYRTEYREPRESVRPSMPRRITRSPSPRDTRDTAGRDSRDSTSHHPTNASGNTSGTTRRVSTRHGNSSSGSKPIIVDAAPPPSMPRTASYRYDHQRGSVESYDRETQRPRHPPTTPSLPRGASGSGSGTRELFGEIFHQSTPSGSGTPTLGVGVLRGAPFASGPSSSSAAASSTPRYTREVRPEGYRMQSGAGASSRRVPVVEHGGHGRPGVSRNGSGHPVHVP